MAFHTLINFYGSLDGLAAARTRELAPPERLRAGSTSPVAARDQSGVLGPVEAHGAEVRVVVVAARARERRLGAGRLAGVLR